MLYGTYILDGADALIEIIGSRIDIDDVNRGGNPIRYVSKAAHVIDHDLEGDRVAPGKAMVSTCCIVIVSRTQNRCSGW